MGIIVRSRPGEKVGQLYRRLKKICEREGLVREMRRTARYEKPSEKRRRRKMNTARTIQNAALAEE
jgi:small subunit ribosomal protein S21